MLQSVSALDRAAQLLHIDWIYDEIDGDGLPSNVTWRHTRLRYFFLPELRLLLQALRLRDRLWFAAIPKMATTLAESERMIVHALRELEPQLYPIPQPSPAISMAGIQRAREGEFLRRGTTLHVYNRRIYDSVVLFYRFFSPLLLAPL